MTNPKYKNYAFTLAEVLITLTIIGVIAAMTIPTLLQNHQKQQTITKLKAAYSIFSQAFSMAAAEHGDIKNWGDDLSKIAKADRPQYFFDNYLKPYLKIEKSCPIPSTECWIEAVSLSGISGYLANSSSGTKSSAFIISNGMTAYYWVADAGTSVQLWVNINGLKNKAILGKDIFGFRLSFNGDSLGPQGFIFAGQWLETMDELINDSQYGCNRDIQNKWAGRFCGELIRRRGWKIDDNYPW